MNEEKKKVLNIVRSLIISSNPRDGLCLRKLLEDFQQYEGKRLPLFEHKSAVEFLQASEDFDIKHFGGEYIVYAKTSAKSRHISKLVAEQNKPRAYRGRHSVQNRLVQTNQLVYTRYYQRSSQEHNVLHQGASTVFSFEELKAKEKEKAVSELILCSQQDVEIVDRSAETSDKEVEVVASTDNFDFVDFEHMDNLELPWEDKYWSLVITCCAATTEIWGKLAGDHCRFDPSSINFQEDMLRNKKDATVFNIGQIYVTMTRGIVYRIRMDNIDYVKNRMLCFFVDEGNKKWLDMNEIYDCESMFMKYPPQAICFSLRGLEDISISNDIAQKRLESTLLGRTLTGHVFTTKEDFVLHNKCNGTKKAIQVCLQDTSGDCIDLYREIVQQMYDGIAVPELVTMKLTPVKISHIDDNGDIFCQLQQNAVNYVKILIKEFVRKVSNNPFRPSQKSVPISSESLFVVNDPDTNQLYRAKVINEMGDGENSMFFIDYGHSKLIPSSKMYLIESQYMEEEIYRYAPQAIRTKLNGVSNTDVEILVTRLRSRFSVTQNAYVRKLQSNTIVPEIKLYFDAESFMVCVNDSFELENERNRTIDLSTSAASDIPAINGHSHSIVDQTFVEAVVKTPKIGPFLPPKLNSCFEISIVKTESPSNFVIKPTEHIPQWQKQMKALQSYCKETSSPMTLDMIKEGEPYACLKSNGYWYRAIIKFHRSKMYAFFCDIADIDNITDLSKIKILPKEYHAIPKLAMTARLFGIEPVNGTWEMDDNVQFHRITKGNKFMAEVIKVFHGKSEENSVLEIILKHKQDVINDLFVASGRAIRSNTSI